MLSGINADGTWITVLRDVRKRGIEVISRERRHQEIIACQSWLPMSRPVVTAVGRKLGYRFMAAEAWWILSGRNDVSSIAMFSKKISAFSDDGVRFNGAYGPKVIDQLSYAIHALNSDPGTRQAVINIWRENPRPSKDTPCTLSVQFLIRNNVLHCVDTMRSSDLWLGWPYDVFNFSTLALYVLLELRRTNLELKDLKLGGLTMNCGSQHIYLDNIEQVDVILEDIRLQDATYYDALDYDEFKSGAQLLCHLNALITTGDSSWGWLKELFQKNKETK